MQLGCKLRLAARAGALYRYLGTVHAIAPGQRHGNGRVKVFQAEHLAAAIAVKVRVAVQLFGDGVESPDPVLAGDTVCKAMFDKPIQHPVQGYLIDGLMPALGEFSHLPVRARLGQTAQDGQYGDACRRGALSGLLQNLRCPSDIQWCLFSHGLLNRNGH